MKRVTTAAAIAVVAAGALALSGCTGGAPGASDGGGSNQITYLIGQPDTPKQLASIKANIASFEKQSGVTVKLNVLPGNSVRTLVQTQLRSGNGPDVFGYDTGPGFAGVLAKAGLLYDLTDQYAKKDYKVFDWAKKTVTFDGKVMGIPDQIEEVGLFYNKDIFTKYGLDAPKTLPQLEKAATTLKANGITPMTLSDKEGWEGGHLLSMALTSRAGAEEEKKLIAGEGDWTSEPVVQSLQTWKDFNSKGWLPQSVTSISYDNANALFYSGKAAMNPTGTWLVQDLAQNTKFDVGFVPFPGPDAAGVPVTGLGSGTFMSAKAKNPKAALKFMDYLVSEAHGEWEVNNYLIPAFPVDTSAAKSSPLFRQVISDTADYAKGGGDVGQNIDVLSTDKFNKAMWDGVQGVLSGSKTPAQAAQGMQDAAQKGK